MAFSVRNLLRTNKIKRAEYIAGKKWMMRLNGVLFHASTTEGKLFDSALLSLIFIGIGTVMLQSVKEINREYGTFLLGVELCITLVFAIEFGIRVLTSFSPRRYILSFYGIVDLIAFIPSLVFWIFLHEAFFVLLVVRVVRILQIFRILDMTQYTGQALELTEALKASRPKIIVFIISVTTMVIVVGIMMYMVEGSQNPGFSSIPKSIYWAIVTLTTVGYGDIAPETAPGRALASLVMLLGYGVIAVPTGIVSAEIASHNKRPEDEPESESKPEPETKDCVVCGATGLEHDSSYCKNCGSKLWN